MYAKFAKNFKAEIRKIAENAGIIVGEEKPESLPKIKDLLPKEYKQHRLQIFWNVANCFESKLVFNLRDKMSPWLRRIDELDIRDQGRNDDKDVIHSLFYDFLSLILKQPNPLPHHKAFKILKRIQNDMHARVLEPESEYAELQPLQIEAKKRRLFLLDAKLALKAALLKLEQKRPLYPVAKELFPLLENTEKGAEAIALLTQQLHDPQTIAKQRKASQVRLKELIKSKLDNIREELLVDIYEPLGPVQQNHPIDRPETENSLFTLQEAYQKQKTVFNQRRAKKTTEDFSFNEGSLLEKLAGFDQLSMLCDRDLNTLEAKLSSDSPSFVPPTLENKEQLENIALELNMLTANVVVKYGKQLSELQEAAKPHVLMQENAERMKKHHIRYPQMQKKLDNITNNLFVRFKNDRALLEAQENKRLARLAAQVKFFAPSALGETPVGSYTKYLSDRAATYRFKDKICKADAIKRADYVKRSDQAFAAFVAKPEEEEIQAVQRLIKEGKTAYSPRMFGDKKKSLRTKVLEFEAGFNELIRMP